MKFYELENEEEDGDFSNIVPNAKEAEPDRGRTNILAYILFLLSDPV